MIIEIPDKILPDEVYICILDERRDREGKLPYMAIWYDRWEPPMFGLSPLRTQIFHADVNDAIRRLRNDGKQVTVRMPVVPYGGPRAPISADWNPR
jgi:hypothetical protein